MTIRILSIQVGRPATYAAEGGAGGEGSQFSTAIAKRPVAAPVPLTSLGLAGDQVADTRVHGGPDQALLAYAAEHYPGWRAEWGRDDVAHGAFGENLTMSGVDEESVCVGDRWQLGAVVVEVTKPRSPCARLAWYQDRDDLIRRVRETGRSGWYLRVLAEGVLEAGMEARRIARPCPEMTVRRAALAMSERDRRPDEAILLLGCDALAADWRYRLTKEGLRRPTA